MGNHDYRGDALAQLSPILKQKDNRWICLRSYIVNTGNKIKLILIIRLIFFKISLIFTHYFADVAEFFFIDTTPFQDMYFTTPKDHTYDWRDVLPRKNYLSHVLKVKLIFGLISRMVIIFF